MNGFMVGHMKSKKNGHRHRGCSQLGFTQMMKRSLPCRATCKADLWTGPAYVNISSPDLDSCYLFHISRNTTSSKSGFFRLRYLYSKFRKKPPKNLSVLKKPPKNLGVLKKPPKNLGFLKKKPRFFEKTSVSWKNLQETAVSWKNLRFLQETAVSWKNRGFLKKPPKKPTRWIASKQIF